VDCLRELGVLIDQRGIDEVERVAEVDRSVARKLDLLLDRARDRPPGGEVRRAELFVGPSRAQATSEYLHWPELVPVTDLVSAHRAIDTILEQGEGARGHWQNAHFGQFVQILDEYRQLKAANPDFAPARPVRFATVRPSEHDDTVPRITERVASRCTDLFNVGYEVLLQTLQRYFAHTEETDAQLATLSRAAITLMVGVLKPLGDLITTLPVGPEQPGMTAGPSFELFYENDYLIPHREAAWALLEERVRGAANFCDLIQESSDARVATELRTYGRGCSASPTRLPATSATGAPSAALPPANPPRTAHRPAMP
jgi:Ferritin-like